MRGGVSPSLGHAGQDPRPNLLHTSAIQKKGGLGEMGRLRAQDPLRKSLTLNRDKKVFTHG